MSASAGETPSLLERDLEDARFGLGDADHRRIDDRVEQIAELDLGQHLLDRPFAVGDDGQLEAGGTQALQRFANAGADAAPGVAGAVLAQHDGGGVVERVGLTGRPREREQATVEMLVPAEAAVRVGAHDDPFRLAKLRPQRPLGLLQRRRGDGHAPLRRVGRQARAVVKDQA